MQAESWALIDQARRVSRDCTEQARELERLLMASPPSSAEEFARWQYQLMRESYRWDLWGAAFVINGGCSDDEFDYFRGWLLLQGRDAWEAAMRDPESLADSNFVGEAECEDVLHAASKVYEALTGHSLPSSSEPQPAEPQGIPWSERDLEKLYPRLSAHFATKVAERQDEDERVRDEWDWQMERGVVLLASGAYQRSAEVFSRVREEAPRLLTKTLATNNLAWANLMIDTPASNSVALELAREALHRIAEDPSRASNVGPIQGTLAFAMIKNDEAESGIALIEEVLANDARGPRMLALRLCIEAIGLARLGDGQSARSLVSRVRKTDPKCQLLSQASIAVAGLPAPPPAELQALLPLVRVFGISDDVERERVIAGASGEQLIALTETVTKETFDQINHYLDETDNAEEAVPFGDLAQAAMEAQLELARRRMPG
jgi:hypothetical protein